MKYNTLNGTDLEVSEICLGTMTWGRQNSESEGFEQMDYAFDQGINFWDTAELYPVPTLPELYGDTEKIIGNWLAKNGKRDELVIATKIAGKAPFTKHIRTTGFTPEGIAEAIDLSLQRLKTDYIDLYQLHWPTRNTNFFGKRDGLVHVSQIENRRLNHPSDVLKEGQDVKVKLLGFDDRGKVRLAMKMVDQETGQEIAEEKKEKADT